jgi:hypothetical protein
MMTAMFYPFIPCGLDHVLPIPNVWKALYVTLLPRNVSAMKTPTGGVMMEQYAV